MCTFHRTLSIGWWRTGARGTVAAVLLTGGLAIAGCGSSGTAREDESRAIPSAEARAGTDAPGPRMREQAARLDVVAGSRVVIPLGRGSGPWDAARLGAMPLETQFRRVVVRVPAPGPGEEPLQSWLPAPGEWTSVPMTAGGTGSVVALVRLPDRPDGEVLSIAGRSFRVNWLPTPAGLVRVATDPSEEAGAAVEDPWAPVEPEVARTPEALQLAADEARTPLGRWRYRLLVDGLSPSRDEVESTPAFEDEVIESIARQNEARWRVALAWLWSVDADLASRLKQRLAAIARFPGGTLAPAWPTDHARLDALLADLLDPQATPRQRAVAAEEFLDDLPAAVAWVIDDGGALDAQRQTVVATVGVTNLMDRSSLAWLDLPTQDGRGSSPQPVAVASRATGTLSLALVREGFSPVIRANLSRWSQTLATVPVLTPATPPGLTLGPLLPDWTLETWSAARVPAPRASWTTAALLTRVSDPGTGLPSWELLMECARVPGAGDETLERVIIEAGAPGSSVRREVSLSGTVTDAGGTALSAVVVKVEPSRWTFRLALPAGAVERDGVLRLSLSRVDALGRRSSWPRPALPWQASPARASIDTSAWESR